MHQCPSLPQIRPTAAICNYKHPQSPDQRRLAALAKSTENPQPRSFVKPMALLDASLPAINPTLFLLLLTPSLRVILSHAVCPKHTQCTDHNCSCHVCADHRSLQLYWKAQYPNSPKKPQFPLRKLPFSTSLLPFLWFSLRLQGGKSTKDALYVCLFVNMMKKDTLCLVIT